MNINFYQLFIFLFVVQFCGGCNSTTSSPAKADLDSKLYEADTLSATKVYDMARALSSIEQDSFYQKLFELKITKNNATPLRENIVFYEKLRSGHTGPDILLARMQGAADFFDGEFQSSIEWQEKALKLAQNARDSSSIAGCFLALSNCYSDQGKYSEAARNVFAALAITEKNGSDQDCADQRLQLAACLLKNDEYEKSIEIAKLCIPFYQKTGDAEYEAFAYISIGQAAEFKNDSAMATDYYDKTLEIRKKLQNPAALVQIYGQYANFWIKHKNFQKAKISAENADFWQQKNPSRENDGQIEVLLGISAFRTGDFVNGKKQLLAASAYALEHNLAEAELATNEALYDLYKANGQPAQALPYFEKYVAQRDSVFSKEKQTTISQLHIQYETAQKELLIAEAKNQHRILLLRTLLIVLSLLIALGFVITLFIRHKGQRQILEKQNQFLKSESQLAEAREMLHLQEIENIKSNLHSSKNELKESAVLLQLKNELIAQLEIAAGGKEVSSQTKVEPLRHLKILTDRDWLTFQEHFERAFPKVIQQIITQFPYLTGAEMRLLLLLNIGLLNLEIADALGISIESVWKAKYRLRKKMDLKDNLIFDEFVIAVS